MKPSDSCPREADLLSKDGWSPHVWCKRGHVDRNGNSKYVLVQVDTPAKWIQHLESKTHSSWLHRKLQELRKKKEQQQMLQNVPRLHGNDCPSPPPTLNSYVVISLGVH